MAGIHPPSIPHTVNLYPTTTPVLLTKGSDKHYGEKCTSPERELGPEFEYLEGRGVSPGHDFHHGGRCASPEKTACDGWCRIMLPMDMNLEYPDVVCWTFNHLSAYPYLFPWFHRFLSHLIIRPLGVHLQKKSQ